MKPSRRRFLHLATGAAALPAVSRIARAQSYPSRSITLVVPFSAGGGADIVARIVAEKMSRTLGQQIVVENRPGAAGTIAMRQVAKSVPDGYTLGLGNTSTLAVAPTMFLNLAYDPRADFTPVGLIGSTPFVLVVHRSVPAQSVQELIAFAKKKPGSLTVGSGGRGSATDLTGALFAYMAAIKIAHVPYKGIAPVVNDLLGGHVSMTFGPMPALVGHIKGGTLRALAVTASTRSNILPNVPTVAESGVPGFESTQRYGIVSSKGVPRAIIDKLNAALREALAFEDVRVKMAIDGTEPLPGTPEEFAADIDREEIKWSKLIKQAGVSH